MALTAQFSTDINAATQIAELPNQNQIQTHFVVARALQQTPLPRVEMDHSINLTLTLVESVALCNGPFQPSGHTP